MSNASRWRDTANLDRAVATAGGQQAFDAAVTAMLDDARGWRLAEMRKRRGMTQDQVAARMTLFPYLTPIDFALFTRAMPAAGSGASSPLSVAATAGVRMADRIGDETLWQSGWPAWSRDG